MSADLTLKEVSILTKKHVETIRRLARQRRIPGAYRVGNRWMFRADAIEAMRGN